MTIMPRSFRNARFVLVSLLAACTLASSTAAVTATADAAQKQSARPKPSDLNDDNR